MNAEELRRLSEAATPGPWRHFHSHEITAVLSRRKAPVVGWPGFDDSAVPRAQHDANAAFIVVLVNLYRSNQLQVIDRDRLARARDDIRDHSHVGPYLGAQRYVLLRDVDSALDSTTGDCPVHIHVAAPDDRCGECGHDLRALCHVRSDSTTGDERG